MSGGTVSETSPIRWVELRVHGVSGTPPYVSLEVDQNAPLDQVAGDARSQFFRRRDEDVAGDASGRVLEAFQ